jgi:hypothetical protein
MKILPKDNYFFLTVTFLTAFHRRIIKRNQIILIFYFSYLNITIVCLTHIYSDIYLIKS